MILVVQLLHFKHNAVARLTNNSDLSSTLKEILTILSSIKTVFGS